MMNVPRARTAGLSDITNTGRPSVAHAKGSVVKQVKTRLPFKLVLRLKCRSRENVKAKKKPATAGKCLFLSLEPCTTNNFLSDKNVLTRKSLSSKAFESENTSESANVTKGDNAARNNSVAEGDNTSKNNDVAAADNAVEYNVAKRDNAAENDNEAERNEVHNEEKPIRFLWSGVPRLYYSTRFLKSHSHKVKHIIISIRRRGFIKTTSSPEEAIEVSVHEEIILRLSLYSLNSCLRRRMNAGNRNT